MDQKIPAHVGLILDGNRRWAKQNGLNSLKGHEHGYKNLKTIAEHLHQKRNVKYVSAYVFSTENWNRTKEEVGYLMRLVSRALGEYLDDFNKHDIKIAVLGQRQGLDKNVLSAIKKAETQTANNKSGTLALCFNYGGQQEIVDAFNHLANTDPSFEISAQDIGGNLYHPEIPPIDLLIRTSGEQRLSGFMLWRASYAELYFTNKHWPEFTTADADLALNEYANRQRRFGA